MKSSKRGGILERVYLEAMVMGLLIGVAALLIDRWVGEAGWPPRILALLVVGGSLCLAQYGLVRARRR
ncbi:MAG TPA: hypothetical protein PKD53_01215 [Chloroflexaceae bacterium]|nr:hypothetical protein [Chloroflexaceae bacterium]